MSARIQYPGIEHGDRVRLTGEDWRSFDQAREYEVDDETFHRPVIYADGGHSRLVEWYIMPKNERADWSVTKVE